MTDGEFRIYHNKKENWNETATTFGIRVSRFRSELLIVTTLLATVIVAFSGVIGFISQMVPPGLLWHRKKCRLALSPGLLAA